MNIKNLHCTVKNCFVILKFLKETYFKRGANIFFTRQFTPPKSPQRIERKNRAFYHM